MDNKTSEIVIASYKVKLDAAKNLLSAAEVEVCPGCKGKGRIDPIENPPYRCDSCDGRGWISPYIQDELTNEVARLRNMLLNVAAAIEPADDWRRFPEVKRLREYILHEMKHPEAT